MFTLAYGMEGVILAEIGMLTAKTIVCETKNNDENLEKHLDWADEAKEVALIRIMSYWYRAISQYNKKTKQRMFQLGHLVLRQVFKNTMEVGAEKR